MTDLFIGTLSATALPPTGQPETGAKDDGGYSVDAAGPAGLGRRLQHMLENLAGYRLDEALSGVDFPDGEWCLRRLDLLLSLDPERPGPSLELEWAKALVNELRQRINDGTPRVLHFPRRADALHDLAASLTAGSTENAWAWYQLGLLEPSDPDPESSPERALLAALRRWPEQAVPAVVHAAQSSGAASLHRLLGRGGWSELAALVLAAVGAHANLMVGSLQRREGPSGGTIDLMPTGPANRKEDSIRGKAGSARGLAAGRTENSFGGNADGRKGPLAPSAPAFDAGSRFADRAADVIRHSSLARAMKRSVLRADGATAAAWAVLSLAEVDPGLLRGPESAQLLHAVSLGFDPASVLGNAFVTSDAPVAAASGTRVQSVTQPPPDEQVRHTETRAKSALEAADIPVSGAEDPEEPENPADADQFCTLWAGLPFLFATAADAGIPDGLLAAPVLSGRPLRWLLHRVGQLLVPAAPNDPAVLVFAGLLPGAEPPDGDEASVSELAALQTWAGNWARTTAVRLGRPHHDPFDVVAGTAFRRGIVLAQPGWIEVHLDLADVDMDIRRAGLDLDPGWIPWLGVVVRYVYS
ncbi:hypothetical protein [Pseudarthrobacter sulfonivorans]|uniref:hypothetical protein n=1 Tax=Pseudarthrobacter sulfonivorans TaxID=121292 RepID=UPI002105ED09|nr:hypothetical protein [Pseudarthrobacter sulfonivorans]